MKLGHIAVVGAAVTALALVVAFERPQAARSAGAARSGITVTGSATAKSVPDQASFTFGVETTGASAADAISANAQKMRGVIAALRRLGIDRADIRTTEVSVYPRSDTSGRISGYSAGNSVTVKVRPIARAGRAVDAVTAAGVNEVSGPSFDRSDRDALYRSALANALAAARAKATALANAAGVSLGRVTRIDEGEGVPTPVPFYAARAAGADTTPIEPGTEEVRATITVTFAVA